MRRIPAAAVAIPFLLVSLVSLVNVRQTDAQSPPFTVVSVTYQDLDGDHDIFPDTSETGRVVPVVQNNSGALMNARFSLSSTDSDVACITTSSINVGALGSGQTVTVGSLNPGQPGFEFRASSTLQTVNAANPARVDLCLRLKAGGLPGQGVGPVCFSLLADLDLIGSGGGSQTFVYGPDTLPATADDGMVVEDFDVDRDGDGAITVNDTFRLADAGTGMFGHGSYLRGAAASGGTTVGGIACGGFQTFAEGNPGCQLDPDDPMDWHIHCAPGATNCPNIESGTCVGGCSYNTPANGQKSLTGPNSLHMGAHFDPANALAGDTTHLRTLQAFVSGPLNLAVTPRGPGDLQLGMFQIVDLMDDNGVGPGNHGMCSDCGDVQIQVDQDSNPAVDNWGFWDKLVPFQNVYDHKPLAFSVFGGYYCLFTPTDTGNAAPAPRGVHETICYPQGAWSHCGSPQGTTSADTAQCPGPGEFGTTGAGVWVETRFDLTSFVGQRVRLRWIGSTWEFDSSSSSYYEVGSGWNSNLHDDGWWIDYIKVTGVITSQGGQTTTQIPDNDTPPNPPKQCH
ncbi:MAG TPA: hypothetical protein VGS03_11085 [Candidatus Polarisedimenticolia bacterium]|jgi:hypothetical protein|nr:hypothetical protein [Candidatus Polarisedimenticolia bacterium]